MSASRYPEIGRRLQGARMARGMTQGALGLFLRRPRSHAAISDIERGKTHLSVDDLDEIGGILGVSLSRLLGLDVLDGLRALIHTNECSDEAGWFACWEAPAEAWEGAFADRVAGFDTEGEAIVAFVKRERDRATAWHAAHWTAADLATAEVRAGRLRALFGDGPGAPDPPAAPPGDLGRWVGARVAQLREAAGWSAEQFADRAGMSVYVLASIEAGMASLSLATLAELALALDVGVIDLMPGGA